MSGAKNLSQQIDRTVTGPMWHGPALLEALEGVTAEQAAARPVAAAHSIWELVLHMASWNGEVTRRLQGNAPGMPEEGDFPEVGEVSESAWQQARERLDSTVSTLRETLAALSDQDLDRTGGSISDRALGTGVTLRAMVVGVLQHAAYHSGQIVMLRKALGG